MKAATAGAGDIDSIGIDIRASEKIVDSANAVPNLPAREVCSGKVGEIAEYSVFSADQVVTALARLLVPELTTLTLADRIPTDDDIAAPDQVLAECLIVSLPVGRVAGRHEHCRVTFLLVIGYIDKRRNVNTGQAFENQLFDVKAVHRNSASNLGPQRGLQGWQPTQHGKQFRSYLFLDAQQVLFGADGLPRRSPRVVLLPRKLGLVLKVSSNLRTWQCRRHNHKGFRRGR